MYRACAGEYSDEKIVEKGKNAPVTKGESTADQDQAGSTAPVLDNKVDTKESDPASDDSDMPDSGNFDIMSSRASLLTEKLIKIGTKVPIFDCPDIEESKKLENTADDPLLTLKDSQKKKKKSKIADKVSKYFDTHEVVESMKQLRGVEHLAEHCLEDWDSESKFGVLSGQDYAQMRLAGHLELFEEEADSLDKKLLVYKIATYAIGVIGGFLSFMSLEVQYVAVLVFPA